MSIYTLDDLRAAVPDELKGASDAELISDYSQRTGRDPRDVADYLGYRRGQGLTRSQFSSSVDKYQGNMYGLGEAAAGAAGMKGVEDWMRRGRETNEVDASVADANAAKQGAVQSWDQVHGAGDFGSYFKNTAIGSAPYMAEFMVGGGLARLGSAGLRAAVRGGDAAAQAALDTRSMAGGVAASYPSSVGDILDNQREAGGGETNLLSAAAGGVPYAALNLLGEGRQLMQGRMFKNRFGALDDIKGVRGGLARAGATAGVTGLEEGAGEVGQEMINQSAGRMAVNPDETMFNEGAQDRYKESFAGGAVLGGAMGGGLGGWRRSAAHEKQQAEAQQAAAQAAKQPTDLLKTAAPRLPYDPRVGSAINGVVDPNSIVVYPDGSTALRSEANDALQFQARIAGIANPGEAIGSAARQAAAQAPQGGVAPGEAIDQSTGVAAQPYAGKQYPGQFNAAADEPTGVQVSNIGQGQLEMQDRALQAVQRRAGILQQEQAEQQALVARQDAVKAEQARIEQVKQRAGGFGVKGKLAVDLFDGLEQKHGINGRQNQDAFDEQVNNLALRANGKVRQHLGLNPDGSAQNVGAQTVSGGGPVVSGGAGGALDAGGMAAAGRAAGAVGPAAGVSEGVSAPAAQVGVQSVQQPAGSAAAVSGTGALAVPEVHAVGTTKGGERLLELRLDNKSIQLKQRVMNRFLAAAGFNADGTFSGNVRSSEDAAKYLTENGGDGHKAKVTRDDVNNALKTAGLTPEKLEQAMQTSDGSWMKRAAAADTSEDTSPNTSDSATYAAATQNGDEGGPTGFRVAKSAADVGGDHFLEAQTGRQKQRKKHADAILAAAGEKRQTETRVAREKVVADGRERNQAEANRREMQHRMNLAVLDPRFEEARNRAQADWDGPTAIKDLSNDQRAGYFLDYIALERELDTGEINDAEFLRRLVRVQEEIEYGIQKSKRGAGAGQSGGTRAVGASKNGPGGAGDAGLRGKAVPGEATDVDPKFSRATGTTGAPVSVEVKVNGHTLTFPDAKAAMTRLQEKIDRHQALLSCLHRG